MNLQLTDTTVVRSGRVRERRRETKKERKSCCIRQDTFASLSCFICCSFHPFCSWFLTPLLPSSSCSVPPQLPCLFPFLPLPLPFPSMYIFRSRVIKSAPAGMCWNRISLILPCPHCATKTQIRINTCMCVTTHAHTNALFSSLPFVFTKSFYCAR